MLLLVVETTDEFEGLRSRIVLQPHNARVTIRDNDGKFQLTILAVPISSILVHVSTLCKCYDRLLHVAAAAVLYTEDYTSKIDDLHTKFVVSFCVCITLFMDAIFKGNSICSCDDMQKHGGCKLTKHKIRL